MNDSPRRRIDQQDLVPDLETIDHLDEEFGVAIDLHDLLDVLISITQVDEHVDPVG